MPSCEYVVELFDIGSGYGPRTKRAEIWDARNIGWSRYDRLPGKMFFTLSQLSPLIVDARYRGVFGRPRPLLQHVVLTRVAPSGNKTLYRGVLYDLDDTGDDVIVDCWDYKALLSLSRSGFKTLYPSKKFGSEIITPEWTAAKGAGDSPLGFVATGTIEDPRDSADTVDLVTSAQFGTLDQNRLQLFYDLTEMGRANTSNFVTFDIGLDNTFVFLKDAGGESNLALVLGGNVSDYQYRPNWTAYRNDVATVATGGTGGPSEIVATDPGGIGSFGLRQDVTTLRTLIGTAGGTTEADQQKAALEAALIRMSTLRPVLSLRLLRGAVEPFDGWAIADHVQIEISNGLDQFGMSFPFGFNEGDIPPVSTSRRIIGVRGIYTREGEALSIILDNSSPDIGGPGS